MVGKRQQPEERIPVSTGAGIQARAEGLPMGSLFVDGGSCRERGVILELINLQLLCIKLQSVCFVTRWSTV